MIFGKVWKTAVANLWKSLKIFVLAKEFDEVFKTEEKLSNPLKQNAFTVLDLCLILRGAERIRTR